MEILIIICLVVLGEILLLKADKFRRIRITQKLEDMR
jgi:hypothetical protein